MSPGPLLALLLVAVSTIAAGSVPAPAPTPGPVAQGDPVATVREAERRLRAAFRTGAGRPELERIAASAIDYAELARRSVGPRWSRLSPSDQAAIVAAQRALVEETYLSGLLRPDPLFALAVLGSQAKGSEAEVTVVVQSGASQGRVELRLLRGKDRRYRIFDATVNGVAILAGYQEQFAQLLDQGGLPRLVESLESQRKALVRMRSGNP